MNYSNERRRGMRVGTLPPGCLQPVSLGAARSARSETSERVSPKMCHRPPPPPTTPKRGDNNALSPPTLRRGVMEERPSRRHLIFKLEEKCPLATFYALQSDRVQILSRKGLQRHFISQLKRRTLDASETHGAR